MEVVIGTASAEQGEKSHGVLEITNSSAGFPIAIPVVIVNGVESGPMLVANAAMHGTESLGTIAISRFYKMIDPELLKGTFIGVPILNTWAFEAGHRLPTLLDHFDLERRFPGNINGSISDRIAYKFMNEIVRRADCLIDFHGQDQYWHPTSAIIVPLPKPKGNIDLNSYQKCIEAADAFRVRQIWRCNKPGSVTEAIINETGIPAISPEFGGITDYRRMGEFIELAIQGIMNVMKWLGILEGPITSRDYKTCICDTHRVLNHRGGIWSTSVEPEDEMMNGSTVGTISDPITAEVLEEIIAPFQGVVTNLWCAPVIKAASMALGLGKVVEYI